MLKYTIQCDRFSQNISYRLDLYVSSGIVARSTMQKNITTDEIQHKDCKNRDNNTKINNNKNNKTRRLKSIVLSTNVNDYDTGENNLT